MGNHIDRGMCGSVDRRILWGDGTSRNDVSPYECSETPGPQMNRPL